LASTEFSFDAKLTPALLIDRWPQPTPSRCSGYGARNATDDGGLGGRTATTEGEGETDRDRQTDRRTKDLGGGREFLRHTEPERMCDCNDREREGERQTDEGRTEEAVERL